MKRQMSSEVLSMEANHSDTSHERKGAVARGDEASPKDSSGSTQPTSDVVRVGLWNSCSMNR